MLRVAKELSLTVAPPRIRPAAASEIAQGRAGELIQEWTDGAPPHAIHTYDQQGDETSQTDANNDTTDFTFDQNGDELTRTLPDGEEESFTYNVNNQVATHTDFDGNTAVYSYYGGSGANAGALDEVVYGAAAGSGKATETVTYTYTTLGHQATVTDASGTTTDSYDAEGDLVDQDTPEGDIKHTYSPVTGELTETSTANTDIAYAYNDLGELTTTTVKELNGQNLATPLVTTDAYDPAGNKTSEILPNGVVTSWTDDDLNRLTSMSEVQGTTTLFTQTFTLKDDGTRASSHQTQLQPDGSTITTDTTWSNNALGELTSETLSSSDSSQDYTDIFKYDLVGNRLTSAHTGPGNGADENITDTYNGDDELKKEVSTLSGETDLVYDRNGSLTTSTTPSAGSGQAGSDVTTYGYDVRNKMISADVNGVTTTYVYDDAGNRVGETTPSTGSGQAVTTFYLTDDDNPTGYAQPIEQKASAAAAPSMTYIIGDRVLAQANAAGAVSYLLTDGHGSTRALTSSAGAVTQTFNYTAFGGAIGFNPAAAGTVFLFRGDAVYDAATGLYLNGDGTRPRDGSVFTQRDPTSGNNSDPLSLHKYLYADADPVTVVDPSGHDGTEAEQSGTIGGLTALESLQFNGFRLLYTTARLALFALQWQPLIFLGVAGTAQLVGQALSFTARQLHASQGVIPAGTPLDVRGRMLEDAAGGNLNGFFPGADSDRFRVFQSIRSHNSGSPELLLDAVRSDLQDLYQTNLSREISGTTASDEFIRYEPNYFQARALTVIVPAENTEWIAQPAFTARLIDLAEQYESGLQVIAYEGFEQ